MTTHWKNFSTFMLPTVRHTSGCKWFDAECSASKRRTRHLELKLKHSPKDAYLLNLLKLQSRKQRKLFQQKLSSFLLQLLLKRQGTTAGHSGRRLTLSYPLNLP